MEYILSPSILSADFKTLGDDIKKADAAGAQWVHIDVMDGDFVPNISFGMPVIKSIRSATDKVFDVHLMVEEPGRFVDELRHAGQTILQYMQRRHPSRTCDPAIKQKGCKVGVSLNPATSLSVLDYVLDDLDMVLIMSVNPGFGGQSYIEAMDQKIRDLRKMITDRGLDVDIQVDGGVTADNIAHIKDCGANVFVAGSAVFNGDIEQNIKNLFKAMEV